jgi:hypothetical protein
VSMPDHETLLGYVANRTPVQVTFTSAHKMVAGGYLPASGVIDRLVFIDGRVGREGLSLKSDYRPSPEQCPMWHRNEPPAWFYTDGHGDYHPRLTRVEPLDLARNAEAGAQVPTP